MTEESENTGVEDRDRTGLSGRKTTTLIADRASLRYTIKKRFTVHAGDVRGGGGGGGGGGLGDEDNRVPHHEPGRDSFLLNPSIRLLQRREKREPHAAGRREKAEDESLCGRPLLLRWAASHGTESRMLEWESEASLDWLRMMIRLLRDRSSPISEFRL